MSKMRIVAIGKVKEKWIKTGCEHFLTQINHFDKCDVVEIKDSSVKEEGKKLLEKADGAFLVALDEKGKRFTSRQFSKKISGVNKDIVFVIGSSDGLCEDVVQKADLVVSLSDMTFTHEMARLFLLEQIYRHEMIVNNRTYHRD